MFTKFYCFAPASIYFDKNIRLQVIKNRLKEW